MEIVERRVSDVTVLDLKWALDVDSAELLKDQINRHLAAGRKKLLLNLEDTTRIDSVGLGEALRAYTTVGRQGGQIKLLGLNKKHKLDGGAVTKLLMEFDSFEVEADAIKSFR